MEQKKEENKIETQENIKQNDKQQDLDLSVMDEETKKLLKKKIQEEHLIYFPKNSNKKYYNEQEFYEFEWLDDQWKRWLCKKYDKQKSVDWLKKKEDAIGGSEVSSALDQNKYKGSDRESFIKRKCHLLPKIQSNPAMEHGNLQEKNGLVLYSEIKEEITFEFGFILHAKYPFLGVSPDGLCLNKTLIEMKAPLWRDILPNMIKSEYISRMDVIAKEIFHQNKIYSVNCITNLSIEECQLKTKLLDYYNQCQYQMEVMDVNKLDFIQLGIFPNRFYLTDTLFTVTHVQRDPNWMIENFPKLQQTWDEITFLREKTPNWQILEPKDEETIEKRSFIPFPSSYVPKKTKPNPFLFAFKP